MSIPGVFDRYGHRLIIIIQRDLQHIAYRKLCRRGILTALHTLRHDHRILRHVDDHAVEARGSQHAVADGECEKGIIICGTGIGISITANKVKGIRAALCGDCFSAEMTRLHNDANILAMGARVVGPGLALKIVDTFLDTPFSGDERHVRRINQIED